MKNETGLKKIRILIVEPEKPPCVAEIESGLDIYQKLVGGNIQFAELDRDAFIYCNAAGKLLGLQGNRRLDNGDIVSGTFVICREDGTETAASLTDEQVEKYTQRFKEPEWFTFREITEARRVSTKSFESSEDFINELFGNEAEDEDEMER